MLRGLRHSLISLILQTKAARWSRTLRIESKITWIERKRELGSPSLTLEKLLGSGKRCVKSTSLSQSWKRQLQERTEIPSRKRNSSRSMRVRLLLRAMLTQILNPPQMHRPPKELLQTNLKVLGIKREMGKGRISNWKEVIRAKKVLNPMNQRLSLLTLYTILLSHSVVLTWLLKLMKTWKNLTGNTFTIINSSRLKFSKRMTNRS